MADSTAAVAGTGGTNWLRVLLWVILILFALFYLAPLYVMIATSLKSAEEIRSGNLLSLPVAPSFDAWAKAWSSACVGVECTGIGRFFFNSVKMVIPAVLLSTMIGALNGYVLTKWTFKGANFIFALILFGCFIPFQIVLIPMARTLGILGLASSTPGLVLVHVVYGLCFTTLYFRNFYAAFPTDLVKAAKIDGAGFFTIFWRVMLPNSLPILVVTVIWQFTNIWNDFLFGASFAAGGAAPITVALNNIVNTSTGVKEYNVDMASAMMTALPTLLVYVLAGQYFVRGMMAGAVKG
ncbi:MAG: carbohydrate ABC transporter permease [Geminicoccaceae bacterium]|jgi:glucose/mannose transport system permease protein